MRIRNGSPRVQQKRSCGQHSNVFENILWYTIGQLSCPDVRAHDRSRAGHHGTKTMIKSSCEAGEHHHSMQDYDRGSIWVVMRSALARMAGYAWRDWSETEAQLESQL